MPLHQPKGHRLRYASVRRQAHKHSKDYVNIHLAHSCSTFSCHPQYLPSTAPSRHRFIASLLHSFIPSFLRLPIQISTSSPTVGFICNGQSGRQGERMIQSELPCQRIAPKHKLETRLQAQSRSSLFQPKPCFWLASACSYLSEMSLFVLRVSFSWSSGVGGCDDYSRADVPSLSFPIPFNSVDCMYVCMCVCTSHVRSEVNN
jgi:hypothetical protein